MTSPVKRGEGRERFMTTQDYGLARRMWHQLEPVHAVFWYAPEVSGQAAALGYEVATRWPSYFAWRLAPLGAAGPRLGAPARSNLSPGMVGPAPAARRGGAAGPGREGGPGGGRRGAPPRAPPPGPAGAGRAAPGAVAGHQPA